MENLKIQTKAAKIIQKNFRKYLTRKQIRLENLKTSTEFEKFRPDDLGKEKLKYSKEVWEVRSSLESFYKKIFENSDRYRYVNDLTRKTDKISNKLKHFKSLNALESGNAKIPEDSNIYNEAKRRHKEKLRQFELQWWEKLNLCDDNADFPGE